MMNFDLMRGNILKKTENGALGYDTTKSKLLDLSFKVPEMRNIVCKDKYDCDLWESHVKEAFEEDNENTIRFLLYLRDIRGGLGERDAFRNILVSMSNNRANTDTRLIALDFIIFGAIS